MGNVKWRGLAEFKILLNTRPDLIEHGAKSAVYKETNEIATEAKKIVPVDEGILKNSGFATLPEKNGDVISSSVGFGGPAGTGNVGNETNSEDVGYAVRVHEDLEAHHTVGQAKYLEVPLKRARSGMSTRLAKRILLFLNKL